MFWNSALLTPLMLACIFYGIPAARPPKRPGPAPSFAGFLYASVGFAMLFAALDQGQRLDWLHSGLINALFLGGCIFLIAAVVRRLRNPNPLIDLPYLRQWNTQLLALGLMLFRFCLLSTIILVPQALAIHGFEADQIGPAILWTALPQLPIAIIAALILLRGYDTRLMLAIGFTCMAAACILNAQLTFAWSAASFYRTELLMGVGQSFAFIGLVSTIVLQAVFSGGLTKPQDALTFSAFFHIVRLFGGQIGVAVMTRYIAVREQLHSNLIGLHVRGGNWVTDGSIGQLAAGLYGKSSGSGAAIGRAVGLTSARVRLQAYTLTFIDGFRLVAWACVAALLLIALMRKSPLSYGELGFPDGEPSAQQGSSHD
jgi:DHA2 family multidrug resistance protein